MTTENYIWCFLAGLLGLLFYLFVIKIPAFKKRMQVANEKFTYSQYLQDDSTAIIASFIAILICLIIAREGLAYKPEVQPYIITIFVCVGFMGTNILIALLGKAQKKIDAIVDIKTDKADGK